MDSDEQRHQSPDGKLALEISCSHARGDIREQGSEIARPRVVAKDGTILLDLWPLDIGCRFVWADGTLLLTLDSGIAYRIAPDGWASNIDDWAPQPISALAEQGRWLAEHRQLSDAPDGRLRVLSHIHEHRESHVTYRMARPIVIDRADGATLLDLTARNINLSRLIWPEPGVARLLLMPGEIAVDIDPAGATFSPGKYVIESGDVWRERFEMDAPRPLNEVQRFAEGRIGKGYDRQRVWSPSTGRATPRRMTGSQWLGLILVVSALAGLAIVLASAGGAAYFR